MPVEEVGAIRNLGIVGQGGVGKTSLGEVMLFDGGATTRVGRLDDGTSAFGPEPEEVRRQLTLTTSFHHLTWRKHDITLLDTPGYNNFIPDTLNCMRAATGLVFVLAPAAGEIKVEAEALWKRAEELKLPRLAFVTKMDRERASFDAPIEDAGKALGAKPLDILLQFLAESVVLTTAGGLIGGALGAYRSSALEMMSTKGAISFKAVSCSDMTDTWFWA